MTLRYEVRQSDIGLDTYVVWDKIADCVVYGLDRKSLFAETTEGDARLMMIGLNAIYRGWLEWSAAFKARQERRESREEQCV